jgi:hypothetical protein
MGYRASAIRSTLLKDRLLNFDNHSSTKNFTLSDSPLLMAHLGSPNAH